jgi:Ca2+-binding EF-hand superfamily protein
MDDNNSRTLEFEEFRKALHDYRVRVKEEDYRKLYAAFDVNRDGSVDYDEFIRIIRVQITAQFFTFCRGS